MSNSLFIKRVFNKMSEAQCSKIYFRVFPTEKMVWDYVKVLDDHRTIYIRNLQELVKSKEDVVPSFWTFYTDGVFFNNSQDEIYTSVADVVALVFQGNDAIIMSYGQTGSGKSLTINGLYGIYDGRGILPRLASRIFEHLKIDHPNVQYRLQVSYAEFSKTMTSDLLKSQENVIYNFKDISRIKVKSFEEVLRMIFKGEGRKQYSENSFHHSHICTSIFTFFINVKYQDLQEEGIKQYKLHVIDFAGVDTLGNFTCLFKNPQDVGSANLAKSHLEQFFLALFSSVTARIKVKQRLNQMIQYLGDSLKKTTILRVIGHIRIRREDLLITISLLRFAELIKGIKLNKFELDKVKQEKIAIPMEQSLSKYNTLLQQNLGNCLNEERMAHIERTINEFLNNKITQLTLINVCETSVALDLLKKTCKRYEEEKTHRNSMIKETESPTKPRKSLSATSSNKLKQKSSRGSSKTGSFEKASRRNTQERLKSSKTYSGSINSGVEKKSPSINETSSTRMRSKTSISSVKRSSKRKSSVSSVHEKSGEEVLLPTFLPEQKEAWELYLQEKGDLYRNFMNIHKENEAGAKAAYNLYTQAFEKLKPVSERKDKCKNDLFMAKLTRQLQYADLYEEEELNLTQFEKCCLEAINKVELEEHVLLDELSKYQSELKIYIEICNNNKKSLQEDFNIFCTEKFQVVVPDLEEPVMPDIIESIEQNQDKIEKEIEEECISCTCEEAKMFERYKLLIQLEKKKRRLYTTKNKQWLQY